MVKTRSDDKDGCDKSELEEILQPLRQNVAEISKVIDKIEEKFDIDFKRHEFQIKDLQTRIEFLEMRTEFIYHVTKLNERKIDDTE